MRSGLRSGRGSERVEALADRRDEARHRVRAVALERILQRLLALATAIRLLRTS